MRKPLRTICYVIFVLLSFILLHTIISSFRNSSNFLLPNYGQLLWHWDIDPGPSDVEKTPIRSTFQISNALNESHVSILEFIRRSNTRQHIRNEDLFGQLPSPSDPNRPASPNSVFVIQVHSRLNHLRLLINSLQHVKYIESSLLVFSSDLVSESVISMIDKIRFARTVQIYFPHSVQVFPNSFPGTNPVRCDKEHASTNGKTDCDSKADVDQYGHTRNGNLAQIKHHWLWKAKFVFDHLVALKHYTGNVIFLEEDNYVVEDILVTHRLTEAFWDPHLPTGVVAFGARVEPTEYHGDAVNTDYFISSRHNQGMGISRAMFTKIEECLSVFCNYDDYNWDWSLQELGRACLKGLKVLIFSGLSRVHHLGLCEGVHHSQKNCSSSLLAMQLAQKLSGTLLSELYPKSLKVAHQHSFKNVRFRPSGGWGDTRDRLLCDSISKGVWADSLLPLAPELTSNRSPVYG